jgi:ABC-type lipoprotein release transport system permease subunit
MGAVRLRARSELRRRPVATLVLVLLVGLAGAAVIAAVAGARRGDRALPQFIDRQRQPDAAVFVGTEAEGGTASPTREREAALLADLPYVERALRAAPVIVADIDQGGPSGRHRRLATVGIDAGALGLFGRPIIVDGRMPDEDRADEVAIDEELAERVGLEPGDTYRIAAYEAAQLEAVGRGVVAPQGSVSDLRVVGLVRYPHDLIPVRTDQDNLYVQKADLYLTPAWWERHGPDLATYGVGITAELVGGRAEVHRLATDVRRLFGPVSFVNRVQPESGLSDVPLDGVKRAIDLETRSLQAFAALAAVAGIVIVGQALSRQIVAEAAETPTLVALGMTRPQIVATATLRAAVIAAGGAALALAGAVALSPLTPIGLARRATASPGVSADVAVLVAGTLVLLTLVSGLTFVTSWWRVSADRRTLASSRLRAGRGPGLPLSASISVALARRTATGAVPFRTAAVAALTTVVAVTAAIVWRGSLDRLHDEPAGYGVTWDVSVGNGTTTEEASAAEARLAADDAVAAFTGVTTADVVVEGEPLPVVVAYGGRGSVAPRVLEGHVPSAANEIALGQESLAAVGAAVGDTVDVAAPDLEPQRFRISGRVVLNSAAIDEEITPGEGGFVTEAALARLAPPELRAATAPQSFLLRFRAGVDEEAAVERLEQDFGGFVVRPLPSDEIDNVTRVSGLPIVLAGLVSILGIGAVIHALTSTVRRRRRELAVLKCLGCLRRQLSVALVWQASALAVVALGVGVPLGVALGRRSWTLTADALGVASGPVIPTIAVAAVVLTTLVVVNAAAVLPAALTRRLSPSEALRAE